MLTHIDPENQPTMVNVSAKDVSHRRAIASSLVRVPLSIIELLDSGEILTKKGPVFSTAIIAGNMAVKKCSELIPLCHSIPVEACKIVIKINDDKDILITCEVETHNKTGIEMEALTGASIAALTVYDMCKAMSHDIQIVETKLLEKTGGKSDYSKHAL